MEVTFLRRGGYPPAPDCKVPYGTGKYEGEKQRQEKDPKKSYRQHCPLRKLFMNAGAQILSRQAHSKAIAATLGLVVSWQVPTSACVCRLRLRIRRNLPASTQGF